MLRRRDAKKSHTTAAERAFARQIGKTYHEGQT
jgi:hypothetical protein